VLFDDNHITIDGSTALSDSTHTLERFQAAGWMTEHCDGHDAADITRALSAAQNSDRPVLIACRTIIGYGLPTRQGTQKAHSDAPGAEEIAGARKALHWDSPPFVVPDDLMSAWRKAGARQQDKRKAWEARLADSPARAQFESMLSGDMPASLAGAMAALKTKLAADKPAVATRKASEMALEVINAELPNTIGGSADLTPSNLTKTKNDPVISPGQYAGRFVHYGIREHGMAAAMNGIALHGGLIPYSGTFLVFSDYCRPAIRLGALMGIRVIYVMTHDSIGLGEDGPTHQPVEHLASLRAMPNMLVMRPADAVETTECWELALTHKTGPTVLALSRQNLPTVRDASAENKCARGAYALREADGKAQVTLLSTGSEIEIALKARDLLQAQGVGTRLVSMPCWELFEAQDQSYRDTVLGSTTVRVAIEAASSLGWDRYIGPQGGFVGMHSFGASAPYKEVYKHFKITPEHAVETALGCLKRKG
jgi:transketolase